jgi:hypothetical protein
MPNLVPITEFDIVFISYDEPNADENYSDLLEKCPWAKRSHGVWGSDAAHKAAAAMSETDRFITVDADNIVREDFFDQELDMDRVRGSDVISWAGKNTINGLVYGNGGIKCWPKHKVLTMRTHENADPNNAHAQVDFCWDLEYIQMNRCYSEIRNNATPQQAWRAGFREGVKMALDRGMRVDKENFKRNHWKNLHRLYVWLMIGADVTNGEWAIYGAREGLYKTMCTDWDFVNVRDFEWLNDYWNNKDISDVDKQTKEFGSKLIAELDLPIAENPLDAQQSKFFKTVYQNPSRIPRKGP